VKSNWGHRFKKWLGLRPECEMGFYLTHFLCHHILRNNPGVSWAVHHTSTIRCPHNIVRGKNVYPGDSPGVYINALNGIVIGDDTNIGPNVGLISANHDLIVNAQFQTAQPIKIGKNCWIGMGAIILPGVELGDYTIVGAGSIVTKSFKKGHIVLAGNPARIIKELDTEQHVKDTE
jgi:acetyltransferase-like isoleucine patch superfamily enzyme